MSDQEMRPKENRLADAVLTAYIALCCFIAYGPALFNTVIP